MPACASCSSSGCIRALFAAEYQPATAVRPSGFLAGSRDCRSASHTGTGHRALPPGQTHRVHAAVYSRVIRPHGSSIIAPCLGLPHDV